MLYQDRHLQVIDKPAGIPTIPPRTGGMSIATESGLLVCHRLDTDTSGVLVLAKSAAGQRLISVAFEERRVRKGYLAHGVGAPLAGGSTLVAALPDEGSCTLALGEWQRGRVQIGRGRSAETRWSVRDRRENHLLIEAFPLTGRTHQVRAHLSASGAPLWGDEAYGGPAAPSLGLHAWWIELPWPNAGDRLLIVTPPPPAFVEAWGAPIGLTPTGAA